MPDTDSDSSVIAVISDSDSWVRRASRCRRRPTRTCTATKIGMRISDTIVSCQDSRIIETSAAATVTTLDRMLVAVLVSTVRTPLTSLASRDWIAPVFVAVKNASSIFWRWANRLPRRSAIAELPTRLVR